MPATPLPPSYWPALDAGVVREAAVGDVLREAAATRGGAVGLQEADASGRIGRSWTYSELLLNAERIAKALLREFEPGERIAVWAPNSAEWVMLEFAAALAGLGLVPFNPAYRPSELSYVLEQSASAAIFTGDEYRGVDMPRVAAEVAAAVSTVRSSRGLRAWISEVLADAGGNTESGNELPHVDPGSLAQIQYTSGTTGRPKGAMLHHRGLVNNARHSFERAAASDADRVLLFLPLFHTAGCANITLGAVQSGCRLIVAEVFDPIAVLRVIESERVTLLMGVPTTIVAVLEAQGTKPRDLTSVRLTIAGGSQVPPDLVRRVRTEIGCHFQTLYGQTEASPIMTQTALTDTDDEICRSVGRVLPGIEVCIKDPSGGAVVPMGQPGEICVRGYSVMLGYFGNAEATEAAIDHDGWLHSGDVGILDPDGRISITGRVKDMIIRGGENIFPVEIENALLEHPDILEVAVAGIPDAYWGEIVACFFRPKVGRSPAEATLEAHCRDRLAPHKTPRLWVKVDAWPLTPSGKIMKYRLVEDEIKRRMESPAPAI